MPTITIEDKHYELDDLPSKAKEQIKNIQFVDLEIARLGDKTAVLQTARVSYYKALLEALPIVGGSDTLKL